MLCVEVESRERTSNDHFQRFFLCDVVFSLHHRTREINRFWPFAYANSTFCCTTIHRMLVCWCRRWMNHNQRYLNSLVDSSVACTIGRDRN